MGLSMLYLGDVPRDLWFLVFSSWDCTIVVASMKLEYKFIDKNS